MKAGGQLKDATAIDWVAVVAFINTHEREESRQGAEGSAWANAARGLAPNGAGAKPAWGGKPAAHSGSGERERRPLSSVECFGCHQMGHYKSDCPTRRRNDGANNSAGSGGRSNDNGAAPKPSWSRSEKATAAMSSNTYQSLSDDEDNSGVVSVRTAMEVESKEETE